MTGHHITGNHPPLPQSFAAFWPYYMAAHQNARNRSVHYLGTAGGLASIIAALALQLWWLPLVGLVFGYACAWAGHFWFERNKPATWVRPWWSLLGDWKMAWMKVTGREAEAVRLGRDLPNIVEMVRATR